jgi:hypothetical protein
MEYGLPGAAKNTGGEALAFPLRHSGTRAKRVGPESILRSVADYGFWARGLKPAPRNDDRKIALFENRIGEPT